jgi:hypothetical protein
MSMLAEIRIDPRTVEQRRTRRRSMRLEVEGGEAGAPATAVVRNLSETGLLIEAPFDLDVGDPVSLDLPETGSAEARVIWARAPFYGCEFVRPVSRAVVSAALLRSPLDEPPVELLGPADRTWQSAEMAPQALPSPANSGTFASLALLGLAIVLVAVALAIFQTF